MDICLTPFKKRFVDNWRKEVNRHLRAGTLFKIIQDDSCPITKETDVKEPEKASPNLFPTQEISTQTSLPQADNPKQQKIRFSYRISMDNQDKKSERLHEGHQTNGIRKNSHRTFCYRNEKKIVENKKQNITEEEPTPLVIIDPQLITPTLHFETNTKEKVPTHRPKTNDREVPTPFKFTSIQKPQDDQFKNKDVFIRCQIQSRDRNSFVVSRSNFIKYTNVTNHSFLNLPSRFQTDKQNVQQTTQEVTQPILASTPRRTQTFAVQAWV